MVLGVFPGTTPVFSSASHSAGRLHKPRDAQVLQIDAVK
jgi:hypothetical protein